MFTDWTESVLIGGVLKVDGLSFGGLVRDLTVLGDQGLAKVLIFRESMGSWVHSHFGLFLGADSMASFEPLSREYIIVASQIYTVMTMMKI